MAGLLRVDYIPAGGIRMHNGRLASGKTYAMNGFATSDTTIRPFAFRSLKLTGALYLLRAIGRVQLSVDQNTQMMISLIRDRRQNWAALPLSRTIIQRAWRTFCIRQLLKSSKFTSAPRKPHHIESSTPVSCLRVECNLC